MKPHEMIAKVRDLPTVSSSALQLIQLLQGPATGSEEVVEVVKRDAALTTKLLRICNSAALGLNEPIDSVGHAILILGHKAIYRMIIAIALRPALDLSMAAYELAPGDFWRHSLLAATAAETMVMDGTCLDLDASTAFTIGLLHDIGKLITCRFLAPDLIVSFQEQLAAGRSYLEAERSVLQTDHAEVGAALAYVWRLPDFIVEGIAHHHQPPLKPAPRLSALAFLADQVAHHAAEIPEYGLGPMSVEEQSTFDALGIQANRLNGIIERALEFCSQTDELVAQ